MDPDIFQTSSKTVVCVCIGFQTEFFEIGLLLFCSVKKVVLLCTMRVTCYVLCNCNYIMVYKE